MFESHPIQSLRTALLMLLALLFVSAVPARAGDQNVGGLDQAGGTIKGIIKYDGKTPPQRPIRMTADPYCAKAHPDDPPKDERWVFGSDGKTLQNVFVFVSKGLEGKSFDVKGNAKLDQKGCVYTPHVIGAVVNQQIDIHNSDPTLHNVQALPQKNPPFNEGMPIKGMVLNKKFSQPELGVMFKCAVHPWMTAYVNVVPHPFFAVTRDDGTFEIKGLPDGEYEISTWHEFKRFAPDKENVKVTVAGGEADKSVEITYAPTAK